MNVWLDGPFEFLNFEEADLKVEEYMKELLKIQKTYRMKLRFLLHALLTLSFREIFLDKLVMTS